MGIDSSFFASSFVADNSKDDEVGLLTFGIPVRGVDASGTEIGVRGHCDGTGPGVVGHNGENLSESPSAIPSHVGVWGTSAIVGVKGQGFAEGVYGTADVRDPSNNASKLDTTGVLGEGLSDCVGVTGLCFLAPGEFPPGGQRSHFGRAAGVLGVSNAVPRQGLWRSLHRRTSGRGSRRRVEL